MTDLQALLGDCLALLPAGPDRGTLTPAEETGLIELRFEGVGPKPSGLGHALRDIPAPACPVAFSRNHSQPKRKLPRGILDAAEALGVDGMKILRHLPPIILDHHARTIKGDPHRASARLLAPFENLLGEELWSPGAGIPLEYATSAGFQPGFVSRSDSPLTGWVNTRRFGFGRCVAFALGLGRHLAVINGSHVTFAAEFDLPDLKSAGIDALNHVSEIPREHRAFGYGSLSLIHAWVIENGEAVDVFGRRRTAWADSPLSRGSPKGVLCPVDETFLSGLTDRSELRFVQELLEFATLGDALPA